MRPMGPARLRRTAVAATAVWAGAVLAGSTVVPSPAGALGAPGSCGRPSGCTAFELQHAGSSYGWYPVRHRHEFKGAKPAAWVKGAGGQLWTTKGMLTLNGRRGDLSATWTGAAYDRGRWEVRMRTDRNNVRAAHAPALTDYLVKVELAPVTDDHCGAEGVTLLAYHPSEPTTAAFAVNALPDLASTAQVQTKRPVGRSRWHTFAVEVTPERVSWFVDAAVVATQPTSQPLLTTPMQLRVSLVATPGATMRPTKVQLDWARYWTLAKPNKKPLTAPPLTEGRYDGAC